MQLLLRKLIPNTHILARGITIDRKVGIKRISGAACTYLIVTSVSLIKKFVILTKIKDPQKNLNLFQNHP